MGARQGGGAIAGEPGGPILPRLAERAAEQQRTEARAIDEQVAFDFAAAFEHERSDVAAPGVLAYVDDLAFDALDAELRRGVFAEERAEQGGVELVGVAVGRCEAAVGRRRAELARQRRLDRQRVMPDRFGHALALQL